MKTATRMTWRPFSFALLEFLDQAGAGILDQVQYPLESFRPSVVGIRHLVVLDFTPVFQQQLDPVLLLLRTGLAQHAQVVPVHGQDQVEAQKVSCGDTPRPQVRQFVTTLGSRFLGTGIGRFADMVGMGSSGVDFMNLGLPHRPVAEAGE